MSQKNLSVEYNGLLNSIKSYIQKLEKIGVNVDTMNDSIEVIEKKVSEEQQNSLFNPNSYQEYINNLKDLNKQLEELWGVYFQVEELTTILNFKLNTKEQSNKQETYQLVEELLNKIQMTPPMDAETGENFTDFIYPVIYNYLKLESIGKKNSPLLDMIKKDSTHLYHILELMNKDIERLDEEAKIKIIEKEYEITKNGFDRSLLLNKDLIKMITKASSDSFISDQREIIKKIYENLYGEKDKIANAINTTKEAQQDYQSSKKETIGLLSKTSGFIAYWVVVATIIGVTNYNMICSDIEKNSAEGVKNIEYDSSRDEITESMDYNQTIQEKSVIVKEIYPWEETADDTYERLVITYEIDAKEKLDIKDYIEKRDIKKSSAVKEKSKGLPEDYFQYQETKYIVSSKEKKYELLPGEKNKSSQIFASIIVFLSLNAALILIGVCILEIIKIETNQKCNLKEDWENYKRGRKNTKAKKEKLKKQTEELKELTKEYKKLLNELKNDPRLCLLFEQEEIKEKMKVLEKV